MAAKRTKLSSDEIEPDVVAQAPAEPGSGIEVRRRGRGGYELVIANFDALRVAAKAANIPADGFLAAAMVQRERFLLGGPTWNSNVDFNASTRLHCVARCKKQDVLERMASAYRARCTSPTEIAAAMRKLDPNFLDGQFDGL